MINSTLNMSRQEWLEDRKKGIGGSDVATILGLNKWKSPYQLWLEKTGLSVSEDSTSEPAYWGNVLEEVVAREFCKRTGKKVRRRNQVFEHPDYPFLRANIDRDVVGENAVLECKTANQFLGKDWDGEDIPASYLCQIQHYMNVLNRDFTYIAVLIGGQKFVWKKIDRDQEVIDMITKRLVDFWENNVIKGIEPPLDGSQATTDYLSQQYANSSDREVVLPSTIDEIINSRKELAKTMKELKERDNKEKNKLIKALGERDASIGVTQNFVITWKSINRTTLDKKLLVEKYPEVAKDESIYKTSTSKRLTEKGIN